MAHFTLFVTSQSYTISLLSNVGVKNKFQFEDFIFLVRYKILLEKKFVNKSGEQDQNRKNRISYKISQIALFALPFFLVLSL